MFYKLIAICLIQVVVKRRVSQSPQRFLPVGYEFNLHRNHCRRQTIVTLTACNGCKSR